MQANKPMHLQLRRKEGQHAVVGEEEAVKVGNQPIIKAV